METAPVFTELITEVPLVVPPNELYTPLAAVLLPIRLIPLSAADLVKDTDEPVKFPVVTSDQYSVLLIAITLVPLALPPELEAKASAVTVTAPGPVVGFTSTSGK